MDKTDTTRGGGRDLTTGAAVRRAFLEFFEGHGHTRVRSAPLVPGDDPTLLFTNAGMVQFKDVFTGGQDLGFSRATSSQKCLRVSGKHNDLEEVGRTPRHQTFFEMLGNFSFGDYFKEEAIDFAWAFLTSPEWCGLPAERLWASVHHSDDEAYALWHDKIGLPEDRILRLGDKDNFWAMGDTGPCGPCTEIHWDRGADYSDDLEERLLEVWNLVFMQYDRSAEGELVPLPKPSVDTGMGLERLVTVLHGQETNYDTDLLRDVIARGEVLADRPYGKDAPTDLALRVIADHARATAFLLGDGILPGNEGRGYVLRRIMRRAIRFGTQIGLDRPFLHETCLAVCTLMEADYPELEEARPLIERAVVAEEELFRRTLDRGLALIEGWRADQEPGATMPGEVAFRLYDTYGFPVDLTELIGRDLEFAIDSKGFDAALEVQRELGRSARKTTSHVDDRAVRALRQELGATEFVGYERLSISDEPVAALLSKGEQIDRAEAGQRVQVVTRTTPFYGESGGQVGDRGVVRAADAHGVVIDTQRPLPELWVHTVELREGSLRPGDAVELAVDARGRADTVRNHSATHLLHHALREVLGTHVRQRGSLVEPGRLRFAFSHFQPVPRDELDQIERLANERVLLNEPTTIRSMSYDDAVAAGALAFFGDKYGDEVRTVRISDSVELCGGTHVSRGGDIGLIKIVSEGGIQAGVRRIEGVAGLAALGLLQSYGNALQYTAELLHTTPQEMADRVEKLLRHGRDLEREIDRLKKKLATGSAADLISQAVEVGGAKVLAARIEGAKGAALRDLGDKLRDRLGSGALLLAAANDGKAALLCMVTKDLTDRLKAGDLVRAAAEAVGGRGGGRPDMAQAGGPDASGIETALAGFLASVKEALGG